MKCNPEHLALAIDVLDLKPEGNPKKNYWTGVHHLKLDPIARVLIMKTTDEDSWFEWLVPLEPGSATLPSVFAGVFKRDHLTHLLPLLGGGKLSITAHEDTKILEISRDPLHLKLPYTTPQDPYPEAEVLPAVDTWQCASRSLAEALNFIGPFIDRRNNIRSKGCATLSNDGTLVTGDPTQIAVVKNLGITAHEVEARHISFTAASAKLAAEFLSRIGEKVEIDISAWLGGHVVFRDAESANKLVLSGTDARFALPKEEAERTWQESASVDHKMLRLHAQAFSGLAAAGPRGTLELEFKGDIHVASLHLSTTEVTVGRRCSHEFAIFRPIGEGGNASPTTVRIGADRLLRALKGMDANTIEISYGGGMLKIAEMLPETDSTEEAARPSRSVSLVLQRQLRPNRLVSLLIHRQLTTQGQGSTTTPTPPASEDSGTENQTTPTPPASENSGTEHQTITEEVESGEPDAQAGQDPREKGNPLPQPTVLPRTGDPAEKGSSLSQASDETIRALNAKIEELRAEVAKPTMSKEGD